MQYIILIAVAVAADQALKLLVVSRIGMPGEVSVIDGFFYINVIPNDGIALGMLADHQKIVIVFTALIMAALAAFVFVRRRKEKPVLLLLLTAIVAGGVGNLIDRIRLGYVIDYIDFRIWPYIFNFADICIVLGCILLVLYVFMDTRRTEKGSSDGRDILS